MKETLKLTFRYIKSNKRRTLLTLLGIIISVSMITSIGNIMVSGLGMARENVERYAGSQEVVLLDLDGDKEKILQENKDIKSLSKRVYEASIYRENPGQEVKNYSYYDIYMADKSYFEDVFVYKVIDGRLPEKEGEIIVPIGAKYLFEGFDKLDASVKIDSVKLDRINQVNARHEAAFYLNDITDKKQVDYTIVGYYDGDLQNTYFVGEEGSGDKDSKESFGIIYGYKEEIESPLGFVKFANTKNVAKKVDNLVSSLGLKEEAYELNSELLGLYDFNLQKMYGPFIMFMVNFLLAIIIVAIVLFIYNVFTTNYNERIQDYGLLKVVGTTNSQLRSLIFFESLFYILVSVPLGYLAGNIAMKIVFDITDKILKTSLDNSLVWLELVIDKRVFLAALIISTLVVFISSFMASRFVLRTNPINALAGNVAKDSSKVKKKKYRLINRFFGYEGFLARRNIDRNKKRYIMATVSTSMSIILFVTVSFLTSFLDHDYVVQKQNEENFMGTIAVSSKSADQLMEDLSELEGIEKTNFIGKSNGKLSLDPSDPENYLEDVALIVLGDEDFDKDFGARKEGPIELIYKDNKGEKTIEEGEHSLGLMDYSYEEGKTEDEYKEIPHYKDFKVRISEKKDIARVYELEGRGVDYFLIRKSDFKKMAEDKVFADTHLSDYYGNISLVRNEKSSDKLSYDINGLVSSYDDAFLNSSSMPMLKVAKIFIYGFISLIAIISALNIINSTYNNIMTRRRELALLKAVGIEEKKLKKLISIESMLSAVNASLLAIVFSIILTYYQYRKAVEEVWFYEKAVYLAPVKQLVLAILVAFILIYISSMIPYSKMKKDNITNVLKEEN